MTAEKRLLTPGDLNEEIDKRRNTLKISSLDSMGLNQLKEWKQRDFVLMLQASFDKAEKAAALLDTVRFENPEIRSAFINNLIDLFPVEIDRSSTVLCKKLSDEEKTEKIRILEEEILSLQLIGITIPDGIQAHTSIFSSEIDPDEVNEWILEIREQQKLLLEIAAIKNEIGDKYHLIIAYEMTGSEIEGALKTFGEPPSLEETRSALGKLQAELNAYPPFMIQNSGIKYIRLIKKLAQRTGAGGMHFPGQIYLDVNSIEMALHHELFHGLDHNDGFESDDEKWISADPRGKNAYDDNANTRSQGILESMKFFFGTEEGFVNPYGKSHGPNEDQANTGQYLVAWGKDIIKRCRQDPVAKLKIEMMTGCEFDINSGTFTRVLPLEEYKTRTGCNNFEYYAKWSQDENGKIIMDHTYWNARLTGKKTAFVKENDNWVLKID